MVADVLGTVVSPSEQIAALDGRRLLIVRPVRPTDGTAVQAAPRIAIDTIGAGEGDRVLVLDEGNGGRQILGDPNAPVKTLVVGYVDEIEIGGKVTYSERGA